MIEAHTSPAEVDDLPARTVLREIQAARVAEQAASARQLDLAARWADLHPPESIHEAATFTVAGSEHEEPIAGQGCPLVSEFCIAELGAVLGISTTSAKRLMGHALELRHRLPRLWAAVQSGRVPAWRARAVAEATIHSCPALTREAARWVDDQVADLASRVGPAQLERLVAEAIRRHELATEAPFDPDGWLDVNPRHATLDREQVHFAGTMHLEAELDIADALDLDRALAHGAATRAALGSTAPLGARRAAALGDLARTQTALDLHHQGAASSPHEPDGLPAAREVVLHAHFAAEVDGSGTTFAPTGRLEEGQRLLLLEQVMAWCGDSRTRVVVKPVIDLGAEQSAPGYAIPERIREQVILRDRACVFPWCSRPARACDIDHVVPHDADAEAEGRPQPGPTRTSNLAALCRRHHRIKTHGRWWYVVVGPGAYEWVGPHGHRFRRDPSGTTAIDPPDRP